MAKIEEFMSNDLDSTLNYYIRNGFQPHPYYYNCSLIDNPNGTPRPFLGIYFMVAGTILLSVYIPCLYIISQSDLMKSSCYKIMLYLGLMDVCCISVNSLTTGFLGFIGATFCSYPRIIYLAGAIGVGCWMGSCSTCILLAINRCCDINHHLWFRGMFMGNNVYITMMIPITYTTYAILFTKPILFNSNYMSWFFNPFLGLDADYYVNFPHTINNCCVSLCQTLMYVYLMMLIAHKNRHAQSDALSKTQKQIFIQSIIICSFNATAAYIYVYMQFFYSPPFVILIGQLAWQCAHGCVCMVYITMNKSIRRKVIQLMVPDMIKKRAKIRKNTLTIIRPAMSIMGSDATKSTQNSGTLF